MEKIEFLAYDPKVIPVKSSGGFKVTLDVSESEFHKIKELNNPENREKILVVTLEEDK